MQIEIKRDCELSLAERRCLEQMFVPLFAQETGAVDDTGVAEGVGEIEWDKIEWAGIDWHVFLWEGEEMVSHVEIIDRIGTVGGRSIRLGGIGGVATRPSWRGHGFAAAAMQKAAEFMREELRVDFGLLICDQQTQPFYRRLGWQSVQGPLVFDQPARRVTFTDVVMVLACRQSDWPVGVIDLCGLPW